MEGIGKDIAILVVGAAIGVIPWFLEKAGIAVPRAILAVGGWLTITALYWGLSRLVSIVEPKAIRSISISGFEIVFLCIAVYLATWWGFRIYKTPTNAISPVASSVEEARPSKAELRLAISGANVFTPTAPDMRDRFTGVAVDAKVWNIGGPSVATDWVFFVIPEGGIPIRAQFTKIPDHLSLGGMLTSRVIYASEALDTKTAQNQISSVPIEGTLLFYVQLPKDIVTAKGTRWELSVTDIYGTATTPYKYWPGQQLAR